MNSYDLIIFKSHSVSGEVTQLQICLVGQGSDHLQDFLKLDRKSTRLEAKAKCDFTRQGVI